jgi:hypothetical protein
VLRLTDLSATARKLWNCLSVPSARVTRYVRYRSAALPRKATSGFAAGTAGTGRQGGSLVIPS